MKYFVDNKLNEELEQFAKEKNLFLPENAIFLYAKDESNNLKSLIVLRKIFMIEPLISENHRATKKLLDLVFDFQEKNNVVIRAFINKNILKVAEKLGFKQEFEDKIIIERIPKWQEHPKEREH